MKILQIIDSLDVANGGPPRVAYGISKAVAQLGHEVTLLASSTSTWYGSDHLEFDKQGGRLTIARDVGDLAHSLEDYDIVHFHDVWSLRMIRLAAECTKRHRPYIVMPHGALDIWQMRQKALKKKLFLYLLGRRALEQASALHLLNDEELTGIRALGLKGRAFQLCNGIDPQEWQELPLVGSFRRRHPELAEKKLVVFMARLHHKKGPDILTKAFVRISEEHPSAHLVLAGPDGGMEASIRSFVSAAGAAERVTLTGLLTGADRAALLQDADVFVLPSHQEGHPLSVVEAAYMRKPLIITPECHCSELIHGEAAEVVSDTVAGVELGLRRVLSDDTYREAIASNAKKVADIQYIWPSIAKKLVGNYFDIIHNNGSSLLSM